MRRKLWRAGLAALVLGGAVVGCHRNAVQKKQPPPDPLLITKKPVEGRPHAPEPTLSARDEPTPPPVPGGEMALTADRAAPPPAPHVQLGFREAPLKTPGKVGP